MKKILLLIIIISAVNAQNENIFPVTLNEKMPELTLTNSEGELININQVENNNILLIFPRGRVTADIWCPICHYQYLEMIEIANNNKLENKYDMAIFFVLPYSADTLQSWLDAIPRSLQTIENWKYPKGDNATNPNVIAWSEYSKEFFPYSFKYDETTFKTEIPILFDADRKVSEGLQIFRNEWGGTKVDQNVPTIFLLDKDRKVRLKYFSQYTNDRLSGDYIVKYLKKML